MKFKKIFIILGLIIALLGFWWFKITPPMVPEKTPAAVAESFQVTEKVGSDRVATLSAKQGDTALSLLENTHKTVVKKYSFGSLVENIEGLANSTNKFWIYYVNGKAAEVGADQYKLQSGDIVEWKFEEEKK